MGNYRNLIAWQKAVSLVDLVYEAARRFPQNEVYELSQQMRSAASSIPSLLAEGQGRFTTPDQRHFYREARGSALELQTQIQLAIRRQFINPEDGARLTELADEVGRLINGLLRSLRPRD